MNFFMFAIKFVWRRNLYDKTLAVILKNFLAHIVECDAETQLLHLRFPIVSY